MPSSLPVLRARPSENTLKLAMVSFSAPEFSASTESTRVKCIAGRLRHALPGAGFGNQRRHLASVGNQHTALQRDHGNAGQALKLQADLGVGAYRRRRSH